MKRLSSLPVAVLLIAGCSTPPVPHMTTYIPYAQPYNAEQPTLRLSERVIDGNRAGAAYTEDDLSHVLILNSPGVGAGTLSGSGHVPRSTYQLMREQISTLEEPDSGRAIRVNSAWVRYCDSGIDMTSEDWRYVTSHGGAEGVPTAMHPDCIYPK